MSVGPGRATSALAPSRVHCRIMPTYVVIVRDEQSFHKLYVPADGEEQAVAEARQRGFVVDQVLVADESVRPVPAPSPLGRPTLEQISSCPCGYSLDGLAVQDGGVRCPECGQRAVLARWRL